MSKKLMNEESFEKLVYQLVSESIEALSNEINEKSDDNSEKKDNDKKNGNKDLNLKDYFNQRGINDAAFAYKLYNVKPVKGKDTLAMKNARSKFYKNKDNFKDDKGNVYGFDSSEKNKLASMISNSTLSESDNKVRITESDLTYMINEAVKRILKESNDYEGNDLTYNSIYSQAQHIIPQMEDKGMLLKWRNIAKEMGFHLETLNDDDMELMKDAIEDAMREYDYGQLKDVETSEAWDEFDDENGFVPSVGLANAGTRKNQTAQDVDDALSIRNGEKYWNKRELANRDKMMGKYINGSRDEDDIEDAWNGIHY